MNINNFDQSSTGTSITLQGGYSGLAGQAQFDSWFEPYGNRGVFAYRPAGVPVGYVTWDLDTKNYTLEELADAIYEFDHYQFATSRTDFDAEILYDDGVVDLQGLTDYLDDTLDDLFNKDSLRYFQELVELDFVRTEFDVSSVIDTRYDETTARPEIIFIHQKGTGFIELGSMESIQKLAFQQPIVLTMTINGVTFDMRNYIKDLYVWDKSDVFRKFRKIHEHEFGDHAWDVIEGFLPDELGHID